MKNIVKIILIILGGPLSITPIFGQKATSKAGEIPPVKLVLIARYYGDSAVLRWGFESPSAWTYIDKAGFVVERVELDEQDKPLNDGYQKVATVKSWTLQDFEARAPRTDTMAMVAAQCLHGKTFEMTGNNKNVDGNLNTAAQIYENRFRFAQLAADLSPIAAEGLGWRWADKNVKPNHKYIYRISTPVVDAFFKAEPTGYILPTDKIYSYTPPQYFEVENGDKYAELTWEHTGMYTAYLIEKSEDGVKFKPAVSAPYIAFKDSRNTSILFKDSLATNYKSMFYRVRGLSPFGEKSDWSKPQEMRGRDLTPPSAPSVGQAKIDTSNRRVTLDWQMNETLDLKGFDVVFSTSLEKPFEKVTKEMLPNTARQYQTVLDKKYNSGYYKIIAIDTANNATESYFQYVFIHDLDPPSQPKALKGRIDTNGMVILTWAQPVETDVQGYTIQFANATYHTFAPTAKGLIADTTFAEKIDLRTLTEHIYYRIAAVDRNENVSAFSEVLDLKKPDKIKPVAPNFKDYRVSDSSIFLAWHPSTSSDAIKQRLYRRLVKNTEGSKMIAEMNNSVDSYTDTPPTMDMYAYTVETEDDDGLRSIDGDTLNLKLVDNKKLKNTPKLSAKFDETNKNITLTWQFSGTKDIHYALYRAIADAPLEQIKAFDGQVLTFSDTKISNGVTYKYAIKAVDNEDRASNLSEVVSVQIK